MKAETGLKTAKNRGLRSFCSPVQSFDFWAKGRPVMVMVKAFGHQKTGLNQTFEHCSIEWMLHFYTLQSIDFELTSLCVFKSCKYICWWVCTHSTHLDLHFRIFWHLCILEIFTTIRIPSTPLHPQTLKCPAHMSTISECFITCPPITHQHISEYLTSSTHVLHVARTFAHSQTHIPSYPTIFQVHYIAYPNIFLHESTHSLNIQYYPCMACRIFATPSETIGHQFSRFYSICNAFICIPKYFYCTSTHIHAFSGLHSSPSIWHLSSIL